MRGIICWRLMGLVNIIKASLCIMNAEFSLASRDPGVLFRIICDEIDMAY